MLVDEPLSVVEPLLPVEPLVLGALLLELELELGELELELPLPLVPEELSDPLAPLAPDLDLVK